MSIQRKLGENHEVLSRNAFCSGYVDSFGKWNNGFPCPRLDEEEDVFCCGTSTYRYCCTDRTGSETTVSGDFFSENLPLVLGVAIGALVTIIIIVVISCCYCRCCVCYKKRCEAKRDRMYASTSSGVANMYSCSSSSLGRRDAGREARRELENMLQVREVEEAAVTRQNVSIGSLPRTFASYRTNRASLTDSIGNTSVSTTTDNERQLFIEQSVGLPPPYKFNKLGGGGGFEDVLPYPPSFSSARGDLGSGHYLAGMSPNDDSFYRATKM